MRAPTVLSVFGVRPSRIGSNEAFARELSRQLGAHGWRSVQCFLDHPPESVRQFLQLPTVSLAVFKESVDPGWAGAWTFAALMRRFKPTIVHLHYVSFLGPYPWLARAHTAKQVFFTDHTSRPEGHVIRRAPIWKRSLTRLINFPISRIISVSEFGYRCITGLDVLPRDRFTMIYNAVDLSRVCDDGRVGAQFRAKHGIPADAVLIVQVSWIIPEKGIVDLLSAARVLHSRGANTHVVFVGEGAYRHEYTRLAREMGLEGFVTWTGLVEDPIAQGVFAAADIVCQVSRWEEVFGWTIAEAMAHRRPLVATRVGGIPELVEHDVSGFLVDRGNVHDIAEKILLLAESPALRARMGECGRRRVESTFNLRQNVSRLLQLYQLTS